MRAIFMTLLAANLLFLAWAEWIDAPRDAGARDTLSGLPRLQLVGETDPSKPTSANSPAPPPPAALALAPTVAEKVSVQIPDVPAVLRCTSVGPVNDIGHAASAAVPMQACPPTGPLIRPRTTVASAPLPTQH